jgi:hypothetical protein
MANLRLLAAVMTLVAGSALAQVDTLWTRTFDGTAHDYDYAGAIAVDGSGSIFVAGYTTTSGTGADFVTIKYYPNGDTAWVRTYNGPGNAEDIVRSIAVDADGNAYAAGMSRGTGTGLDFATVKYDALGNTRWIARYSAPGDSSDILRRVRLDGSGNVYVTGHSYDSTLHYSFLTVKYDSTGDTLWTRQYDGGGNLDDYPYDMVVDSSGNAYVAGWVRDSTGQGLGAVLKYGPNGTLLWSRRLPVAICYAVALGDSGRVYSAGYTNWGSTNSDFMVAAYDAATGDTAWVFNYDGDAHDDDQAWLVAAGPDGTVYASGTSCRDTVNWNVDYLTVKLQANGSAAWIQRRLGAYPGGDDYAEGIAVDAAGSVYVTGRGVDSTNTNVVATVAYGADGSEEWYACFRPNDNGGEGCAIAACDSAAVCVTGYYYYAGTANDIITIKYGTPEAVAEQPGPVVAVGRMAQSVVRDVLWMGDRGQKTGDRARLLDISGRKVLDLRPGANDVRALAPGVYFVRAVSREPSAVGCRRVVVTH